MEKERLAIGCNVDRPTYDWLQAVRSKLQKDSFGNVSMAQILKDILKKAQQRKFYGEV
jgi:hypothetical protein